MFFHILIFYIFQYDFISYISAASYKIPAHRCCPQNILLSSLFSCSSFLDVVPFIYCIILLVDIVGGADMSIWIWSLPTCPTNISTSLLVHICLIRSLVRSAILPVIGFLYFVIYTIWYFISYVAWEFSDNFPFLSPHAYYLYFTFLQFLPKGFAWRRGI